jgi:hypothetical protein
MPNSFPFGKVFVLDGTGVTGELFGDDVIFELLVCVGFDRSKETIHRVMLIMPYYNIRLNIKFINHRDHCSVVGIAK